MTDEMKCTQMKLIGLAYLVLFVLSLMVNPVLLVSFYRLNKKRPSTVNMFLITLTSMDILCTIVVVPPVLVSNLNCKWIFPYSVCVFSAFIMYFVGCSSIYMMCAISIERVYAIYRPSSFHNSRFSKSFIVIFGSLGLSLFWSIMPLTNRWSHYSFEGLKTSCAVNWVERSINVMSYNLAIFTFVFALPFICLLASNIKLILMIRKLNRDPVDFYTFSRYEKWINTEKRTTFKIMLIIATFCFTWLPYAFSSMYIAFVNSAGFIGTELAQSLPALFAKSSILWTGVVYVMIDTTYKKKLKHALCMRKPPPAPPKEVRNSPPPIPMVNLNKHVPARDNNLRANLLRDYYAKQETFKNKTSNWTSRSFLSRLKS